MAIAATCLTLSGISAMAQTTSSAKDAGKIGHQLMDLYESNQVAKRKGPLAFSVQSVAASPSLEAAELPIYDGYITIDAIANGDAADLLAELENLGLRNGSTFGRVVSGQMPINGLAAMNSMSSLVSAVPSLNSANAGVVTSQGDEAQASDIARSIYGVDGTGVKVGTLSDSYDCTNPGAAAIDQANDDLPQNVDVLLDLPGGCIDEGRAMMQIIHDVAPGSDQAFNTAFTGVAGFANGIIALQEVAGADVIVDDIIYFNEPMFQDGPIAQAATQVADNGSPYFSSAGNGSFNSWEDDEFRNSGVSGPFGGVLHDFDPGPGVDIFQDFVFLPGSTSFSFQWDQPYASAGSATGSASDLDVYIYFNGSFTFLGGFNINNGGDPIEVFGVRVNGTQPLVAQIAIGSFGGPPPNIMKYVHFGSDERSGGGPIEYDTDSPTSFGHSNSANVAGVGAAAYFNTAAFNDACEPACVNSFSALGGVPILYDLDDNPVNEIRNRPNFVGPDGGNNTFFGGDFEPDGFPNFFGTSASAPHAAAAAALVLETNPSLSSAEVYELLEQTATDMDEFPLASGTANVGATPGFDFRTGFGFINVDAAVDAAATDPSNSNKRLICIQNRGRVRTISVSVNAIEGFIRRGDKYGPCE